MGFLPNGDLILISLDNKIYLYSFKNKPITTTILWDYSRSYNTMYDTETPENVKELGIQFLVYQTKLFLFNRLLLVQWDLLEMTFEVEYNLINDDRISNVVINQNQTLLALDINGEIDIFSMETGMWISKYG
jgi:hypothetical protein